MARKVLFYSLLLLSILGICISGYKVVSILLEYKTGEDTYQQIQEMAVKLPTASDRETVAQQEDATVASAQSVIEETATEETVSEESVNPIVYPEVDFDALLSVNSDVVGWIYIPGTEVNYPILQGEDNRYYVSALIDGTYNGAGSIFMDYRNAPDFADRHTILYGHNMANGTMFAGITKYRNQEFYDEHPVGMIVTPEKQMYFEIVAAYVATLADSSWQLEFVDDADAMQWVADSMARSPFDSRYEPQLGDRIITLSTCSYEMEDARFVVAGILLEE